MEWEAVSSKAVNAASDAVDIIAERAGRGASASGHAWVVTPACRHRVFSERDLAAKVFRHRIRSFLPFLCDLVEGRTAH
tara:strand:- start:1798 stop:2034 length:237 start_codon:yes stop_codon:yes gene_type:complete